MFLLRARWALLLVVLGGCSPELDWREFRPAGSAVQLLMPCRPKQVLRDVTLGGRPVRVELHACSAGSATWGLAMAHVSDPAAVDGALRAMAAASLHAVAGDAVDDGAAHVPGSTPFESARRAHAAGHAADGTVRMAAVQVFAVGTQVFQMSVLADPSRPDGVSVFMDSARVALNS